MRADRQGRCRECGAAILVGEDVERDHGGLSHVECIEKFAAAVRIRAELRAAGCSPAEIDRAWPR